MTLPSRIEQVASGTGYGGPGGAVTFVNGDDHDTVSWADLHGDARSMAAAMQSRGVTVGDHVAILGPTTRSLVTAIEATWLCGACLVMLPLPMRMGSIEAFIDQTRDRVRSGDVSMLLIDPQFSEFITPIDGDPPFVGFDDLFPAIAAARVPATEFVRHEIDPDSLAVLQFTSGSTSHPKGVMLPHRQICANLDGAIAAAGIRPEDTIVSWLPLYHDMGLIGMLTIPFITGIDLVLGAPQDFLAKPLRWMQWISEFNGTLTSGPNFSWVLAARSLRRGEDLDLSSLRVALNGAEPIDPDSFRTLAEEGARFGLSPDALFPAFGMAEVCIAGVFPVPMTGMHTDVIDGRVLEHEHFAASVEPGSPNARELAILGRAIPGLKIRVVNPSTGSECRDREVGELLISGTSVTTGYYKQPDATAELIVNGWLHTGDLAYMVEGELVMCGRIKDVIIVGGRNIYPQDIEKVVGAVDGVRAGNVIAFGQDGRHNKEHLIVVAETRIEDADELSSLRTRINHEVQLEVGVPVREVRLVPPATIPKTSSGKLQRSACRTMFDDGELDLRAERQKV